jgi:uncharacterized membrane protein
MSGLTIINICLLVLFSVTGLAFYLFDRKRKLVGS